MSLRSARIFSLESEQFSVAGYVDPAPAGLAYTKEHGIPAGKEYATPEAILAAERLDLLMIGSPVLRAPGILLLCLGVALQAGATGAVRAIKMSTKLKAPKARAA